MLKLPFLIAATLVLGSSLPVLGDDALKELQESLGSNDFEARKAATEKIWRDGDLSLELLDQLIKGGDPEIMARASALKLKIQLGITPETPVEILALIEEYFEGSVVEKVFVMNKLKMREAYSLMMRLNMLEEDEEALYAISGSIKEIVPKVQLQLLKEKKFREARGLLLLNHDFDSLIAYASLCDFEGSLDQEIGRLRQLDSEDDRARYLACLRVKGDPVILRQEARRLGDRDAEMVAGVALGEIRPLFEEIRKDGDLSIANGFYLDWVIGGWAGDSGAIAESLASLKHHLTDSSEMGEARRNLLRMGYRDEVLRGYSQKLSNSLRYDFYIGQDRNIEALKMMGLEEAAITEEWLEQVYQRTLREFSDQGVGRAEPEFFTAALFFESRGMIEEGARCYQKFFDAVRVSKRNAVENWITRRTFSWTPRSFMIALAREVRDFDLELSSVIEAVFPSDDYWGQDGSPLEWLMVKLFDGADQRSPLEILQLVASFHGEPMVDPAFFEEVEKRLRDETLEEQNSEMGLRYLLGFATRRQQGSDVLLYCDLLKKEGFSLNPLIEVSYHVSSDHYQEAAACYREILGEQVITDPATLQSIGMVLSKVEDPKAGDYLSKALLYSQGTAYGLMFFGSSFREAGELEKGREYFQQALLRTKRVDVREDRLFEGLLNLMASAALEARDWDQAEALHELQAWVVARGSDTWLLRDRFQILLIQGMRAMEEGRRDEAVARLRKAHSLIPRDGLLANDFFPLLRESGLSELHDELFEKSAELAMENVRFFPKDHNAKNTFAWLASRANRRLDESEELLKKSLEIRPLSSAYLDTMAEIQFARKNREEAIKWSDQSLDNEVGEFELRHQNRRFRFGPFPVE